VRIARGKGAKADALQPVLRALSRLGARSARCLEADGDVLKRGLPRSAKASSMAASGRLTMSRSMWSDGEFLAIVGGSGSGKTTLLRLANRLIATDSGTIAYSRQRHQPIADPIALRRSIGYVFQSGGLFPHMTVADNIGITPRLLGAGKDISARVDELIDLVRLDHGHRNRFPHELSGGQRSASAWRVRLAAKPKIVLMDEPFGALDPLTRDALGEDYRALHRRLGLTTVMITHDMTEALLLADRIAVMRAGRLVAQGTAQELSASDRRLCPRTAHHAPPAGQNGCRNCCRRARHEPLVRSALERCVDAVAGLSRQPCPRQPHGHRARPRRQLPAGADGAASRCCATRARPSPARCADGAGPCAAGAVLSFIAGACGLSLQWFGTSFSAFGFLPAVLALALYSMLPVLRNTITGLQGIDPAILEAAEGVGMTPRQSLMMVELPLALPVIMAGIRTAAVWVIGTATLSTPIGQTSLGNYIFAGLQTQNWVFVLFGCAAAAALALAVDQLLALIENGVRLRSRTRLSRSAAGLALIAGHADPFHGTRENELCCRRQDVHRTIHSRR
jgi:osmoprotectant transport system ATP-binding protein